VSTLVLTAHGSADPRSAESAHEVAATIRRMRRDVDVRVAFCEQNFPNLRDVRADVLGEDDRLVAVLRQRLTHAGVSQLDPGVGILVTAVGSSRPQANTRTALVAEYLAQQTRWRATTAFATGPQPTLAQAADLLRERGATRLVVAPWFLAYGRLTDRIAEFACAQGISMAAPLGPHRLVADTVLDRFDQALAERAAA
jgi:sirohydrochlorin ferrochelatase